MTKAEKKLDEARSELIKSIADNCPDSSKANRIYNETMKYSRLLMESCYDKCKEIWKRNGVL